MASIKCGRCNKTHGSVEQVKACYAGKVATIVAEKPEALPAQNVPVETNVYAKLDIPASKYALIGTDGQVEFFEVRRPTKGKYAGAHFVDKLIGQPGDFAKILVKTKPIAARLLHDSYTDEYGNTYTGPAGAALRFSRLFTCCAKCASALSDTQSLATGFGPVCADKLGVHYYSLSEARAKLGLDDEDKKAANLKAAMANVEHNCDDFDNECCTKVEG